MFWYATCWIVLLSVVLNITLQLRLLKYMFHTFCIHHKYLCCNLLAFGVMIGSLVSEQPNLCFIFHSSLIFRVMYVQLLNQAFLIVFNLFLPLSRD